MRRPVSSTILGGCDGLDWMRTLGAPRTAGGESRRSLLLAESSKIRGDFRGLQETEGKWKGGGNSWFTNPSRPKSRSVDKLGFRPNSSSTPAASNHLICNWLR